jgi:hypothetical protein
MDDRTPFYAVRQGTRYISVAIHLSPTHLGLIATAWLTLMRFPRACRGDRLEISWSVMLSSCAAVSLACTADSAISLNGPQTTSTRDYVIPVAAQPPNASNSARRAQPRLIRRVINVPLGNCNHDGRPYSPCCSRARLVEK